MTIPKLFIQSNSPGEITSWVKPIVLEFKKAYPNSKVFVYLTPCQYATGNEKQMALSIDGVDEAFSPKETLSILFKFPFFEKLENTFFIYLGGDPFYSRMFKFKYSIPLIAYTEHRHSPGKFFDKVFFKEIDGDLMAAHCNQSLMSKHEILNKYKLKEKKYTLIFCGSRPQHFESLFPIFALASEAYKKENNDFNPLFIISPFVKKELVDKFKNNKKFENIEFVEGNSLELIKISHFMITIPGTNNAEAMYLSLPFLVFIPLNDPKKLIVDGIPGLLGKIPFFGNFVLNSLVKKFIKNKKMVSLANMMAKKRIVPEFSAVLNDQNIKEQIDLILKDSVKYQEIKESLKMFIPNNSVPELMIKYLSKFVN